MKHLLLTTIAAVLLVGCGESQPTEPTTAKAPDILIAEVAKPESPTAKPANPQADRALIEATATGNVEAVKKAIADGADVNVKDKLGGGFFALCS